MSKEYLSSDRYFFDEFILIIIVSEYFKRGQSFYSQKKLMKACLAELDLCYTDSNVIFGG